jgi:hypothetical protein
MQLLQNPLLCSSTVFEKSEAKLESIGYLQNPDLTLKNKNKNCERNSQIILLLSKKKKSTDCDLVLHTGVRYFLQICIVSHTIRHFFLCFFYIQVHTRNSKKISLLAVSLLFLFAFFKLILDAPLTCMTVFL